jgi:hypothetical protein
MASQNNAQHLAFDILDPTEVSLAVEVLDAFTQKRAYGQVSVRLPALKQQGLINLSGYFLFLNLPPGVYSFIIEAEHYFSEEFSCALPTTFSSPPHPPFLSFALLPRPSYPFPPRTTLIRGMLRQGGTFPVAGARVDVAGTPVMNRTTAEGEFVLPFGPMGEEGVIKVNGKTYIRGNGDHILTLRGFNPLQGTVTTVTCAVEEGGTEFIKINC